MSTSDGDEQPPVPGDGSPTKDRTANLYLADQLAALRRDHQELVRQVTNVAADSSEILPRIDALDLAVERVGAALGVDAMGNDRADRDDVTPPTRWSKLDREQVTTAWTALAEWVLEVLNGEYRLTRTQLPDCWPVHRRAVRELAWLRTLHVATTGDVAPPAEVIGEWHTRWLPAALHNIATAIDPRECAPGRHRFTDAERRRYHQQLVSAGQGRGSQPVVTTERGPDRPRYHPDRMPPRRGRADDLESTGSRTDEPPPSLDEFTPPPVSEPEHWWEYYLDARLAEIAAVGGDGQPGS